MIVSYGNTKWWGTFNYGSRHYNRLWLISTLRPPTTYHNLLGRHVIWGDLVHCYQRCRLLLLLQLSKPRSISLSLSLSTRLPVHGAVPKMWWCYLVGWEVRPLMAYWQAPDDRWGWLWSNWWNEDWQGKPKYSEKTCPSATLPTTNPTWPDLGSNPGRRGGKPASNRMVMVVCYSRFWKEIGVWCVFEFINYIILKSSGLYNCNNISFLSQHDLQVGEYCSLLRVFSYSAWYYVHY
jgi:hypothetical protein